MPDAVPRPWADRLIAEAVRLREEATGEPAADPAAAAAAIAAAADFEGRIVARAAALPAAAGLRTALHRLAGARTLAILLAVGLAVIAGGSAAGIVVAAAPGEPVNVFRALSALLGLHVLALALWIAAMAAGSRGAAASLLGAAVLATGRRIAGRLGSSRMADAAALADAAAASAIVLTSARGGRWFAGAVSHGLWLAFFAGCIAVVLLLLATRHVTFVWETTILGGDDYAALTAVLGALPRLAGFSVPTAAEVLASEWRGPGLPLPATSGAWAGFLVGCLVIYGALVRALLLAVAAVQVRRAIRGYRLDTTRAGFARLYPMLNPVAGAAAGGADDRDREVPAKPPTPAPLVRTAGPTAVLGLEIDVAAEGWAPAGDASRWLDLGLVDDRTSQHQAIARLKAARPPAREVVVIAALTTTPDRGIGAFLGDLQSATATAVRLALTGAAVVAARSGSAGRDQRIADWQRCAIAAGIPLERVGLVEDQPAPAGPGHAATAAAAEKP